MTITIVTPATSTDLTTLDTVKTELGLTDSTYNALLTRFIKVASSAIETFCGRDFAYQVITETIPMGGEQRILLSRFPVVSLTSVTYEGVTVDSAKYVLSSPEAGFLDNISGRWNNTNGEYDYVISYSYGYNLPGSLTRNLPYDIEQAAIELVKHYYHTYDNDGNVAKETVPQVYETTYNNGIVGAKGNKTELPERVISLLQPHRLYRI
jgi:hypothetical protein